MGCHPGRNFITWSTETFATNQNANAIRWGTLYNFRFDADQAPNPTNATVGFFKTGSPMMVAIGANGRRRRYLQPARRQRQPRQLPRQQQLDSATPLCNIHADPDATNFNAHAVHWPVRIPQIGGSIVQARSIAAITGTIRSPPLRCRSRYTLYDQGFNSVNLSSNGNAQFTTTDTTFTNFACRGLPTTTPSSRIGMTSHWRKHGGRLSLIYCGVLTSISGTAPIGSSILNGGLLLPVHHECRFRAEIVRGAKRL